LYKRRIQLLTVALLFSLTGPIAKASNTLQCTVTQQDGAPVEKIELLLTGSASDKQWKKKTNGKGEVEFKGLPDGTYHIQGAMQGFLLTKATGIELSGNTTKSCAPVFVSVNVLNQLLTDANNAARSGNPDLAIEKGKAAIEMAPDVPNSHIVLAIAYAKKGMLDEALASAKKAAELDPAQFGKMEKPIHMEALGEQANAMLAKHDYDGAIAKYQEIAAIAPDEGTVYYDMALAYGHKGDYQNAIKTIDKAIELSPDDMEFKQRKVQLQDLYLKSTEKALEVQ
jgi:Carboxypeptidase regulatory-like domain/Tetratricopeptide repeat